MDVNNTGGENQEAEDTAITADADAIDDTPSKLGGFKSVCAKLGLIMLIFYACVIVVRIVLTYATEALIKAEAGVFMRYLVSLLLQDVFVYVIPIIVAAALLGNFGDGKIRGLYKKPKRFAKALGNFPAMYGLGQLTNLLTVLVIALIVRFNPQEMDVEKSFTTIGDLAPPNLACGLIMFVHMVFAAAIFEEFIVRGIMLTALKPYGSGFAVIVTGFLFGIMHGNFNQFFYAFVLGIAFGYITLQSGSILTSTILHAMFNSMSAMIMLFMTTESAQNYVMGDYAQTGVPDENMFVLMMFGLFICVFAVLLVVGFVLAVKRLIKIKKYSLPNEWTEIKAPRKTLLFFTSIPVILMLVLAVDAFAGGVIADNVVKLMKGA